MGILIQTDSYDMGGAEKYLCDISRIISKLDVRGVLFCKNSLRILPLRETYTKCGYEINSFSNGFVAFISYLAVFYRKCKNAHLLFVNKIDPKRSLIFIAVALCLRKRVVCIEHLPIPVESNYFFKPPILRLIIRWVMSHVDVIICTADSAKNFFVSHYKYPIDKIKVIHIGVPIISICERASESSNVVRIALVGRLVKQKGHVLFLDVLKSVIYERKFKNLLVEFWGSGNLEVDIRNKIISYSLCDYVKLMGESNNIGDIYMNQDFLVMPSLAEGLPYVLLEAAMFKKPVIAFNVGDIANFIEHDFNGILVSFNDLDAFADAVVALCRNKQNARLLGFNAYKRVIEEFSVERMLTETNTVLSEIVRL